MQIGTMRFPEVELPAGIEGLRAEVRGFIRDEIAEGNFTPRCDTWLSSHSPEFSKKLGARGWLGMTWPKQYGGHERSALDRYVVNEELLAAGAPVAAHWIADRQTGPTLLRFGTPEQCSRFLPAIAGGERYFAIGMSEPDSGSDLASIRTSARRIDGGWKVTGTKVWTSGAHRAHYSIVLCRTAPPGDDRHAGMSQFIVDLHAPGVTIRPIRLLTGEHHFNEMVLDDVEVPDDMVLGEVGNGWHQVTSELAFERSGPERFLSTFPLFVELVRVAGMPPTSTPEVATAIGRLTASLQSLRRLSLSVATALAAGNAPAIEAALVKDLGTRFEREVIEVARLVIPPSQRTDRFRELLAESMLSAPGFTLRGGTNEILRGIVARGLGVR